jgi:hypothetical protein
MPELHHPQTEALTEMIRQQLVREFTAHSRPQIYVDRDHMGDGFVIRYRIFDQVQGAARVDAREIYMAGHTPEGRHGYWEHLMRAIVNDIRRAPASQADTLYAANRDLMAQAAQYRRYREEVMGDWVTPDNQMFPASLLQAPKASEPEPAAPEPEGPTALDLILEDDE